jgi:FKBP12-rapamycin complex-associated protein
MPSKQRPRRISLSGSNGNQYQFLLKGNEDLRQDERVMQLFGLINVCLDNDRSTSNRGLAIVRYSVLPLSNNSGVIGWVENCDTVNALIQQYRESNGVSQLIECRLVRNLCPSSQSERSKNADPKSWGNYSKLPLLQKVEIFKQVLDETTGQDVSKMIWLKSKTSDVWVERRANYTKSIAGKVINLVIKLCSNLVIKKY